MKRLALLAFLVPSTALALDGVEPNAPIECSGGEVFYPRGDGWAFLPQADCQGANIPQLTDAATNNTTRLAAETDAKLDVYGHCLWVKLERNVSEDPIKCSATSGACPADAAEIARKTVFASMRKWTGFNLANADASVSPVWYCPTTGGSTDMKQALNKATIDYNKPSPTGAALNNTQPSLQFFRGADVDPTIPGPNSTKLINKGDTQKCYAPCQTGKTCANQHPQRTDLYECDNGANTDANKQVYLFQTVRNVVLWVKGRSSQTAASWADLGYDASSLAVTETVYWPDTGVAITSDMMLNNDLVIDNPESGSTRAMGWRWNDFNASDKKFFGCDPTNDAGCFHLETVVTHESGHFIGFGHVECDGAVMVPEANPNDKRFDLSIHERAGACAMYRPAGADVAQTPANRYPTGAQSRENEGCLNDGQCTTGKCLFSKKSFFRDATELAAAPDPSTRFAHRGVCVKPPGCANNDDACEKAYGRVCQAVSDDGTQSFCLPGSSFRPRPGQQISNDMCGGCSQAEDCQNGVCVSLQQLVQGGALAQSEIPSDAPASICSAKCYPASGCAAGFTCLQYGDGKAACIAQDLDACITAAADTRRVLNEQCDEQHPCGPGLTCFAFGSGSSVCLEACAYQHPCRTQGFKCALLTDDAGQLTPDGVCFKNTMDEGDACILPSSSTCGLTCTNQNIQGTQVEVCDASSSLACFGTAQKNFLDAKCYTLCSQQNPCKGQGQTCTPVTQDVGVCTPVGAGRCLKQTGEECSDNGECDSGTCQIFGDVKSCTSVCDLKTRTGCPKDTTCVEIQGTSGGVCKPKGKPLKSVCGNAEGAACGGCQNGKPGLLDITVFVMLAGWLLRRRV